VITAKGRQTARAEAIRMAEWVDAARQGRLLQGEGAK
jgi:hypothetical protein